MFEWLLSWLWVTASKESFPQTEWLSTLVISKVFKEFQSRQNETTLVATGNEEQNNKIKTLLILTLITLILMLILMHIISFTQK